MWVHAIVPVLLSVFYIMPTGTTYILSLSLCNLPQNKGGRREGQETLQEEGEEFQEEIPDSNQPQTVKNIQLAIFTCKIYFHV